jgi:predicted SAM-dependent methyltransferase
MNTYLNLGCGERLHPDWINIDLTATGPNVIAQDFTKGIPFAAESVDVVYHAAVFEHIRRKDAGRFLLEIHRVLKPGGIIRVGVPDLEKICRIYLQKLEAAFSGEKQAGADYDWIMLEMLDQMVRETSGGEMLDYLQRDPLPNEKFVFERIGGEGRKLIETLRRKKAKIPMASTSLLQSLRNRLLIFLGGSDLVQALSIGRFRLSGEVHHWMYDRFSLARELVKAGFEDPVIQPPSSSAIPNWPRFHLDVQDDGTVNKPDLLFMEAIKPKRGPR